MSRTLFTQVQYDFNGLMSDVRMGQICLPDIQREFIWKNIKVRDLFDLMYRGYPVGYLLFWQNGLRGGHRVIGDDAKQVIPQLPCRRWPTAAHVTACRSQLSTGHTQLHKKEYIEIAFNPPPKAVRGRRCCHPARQVVHRKHLRSVGRRDRSVRRDGQLL